MKGFLWRKILYHLIENPNSAIGFMNPMIAGVIISADPYSLHKWSPLWYLCSGNVFEPSLYFLLYISPFKLLPSSASFHNWRLFFRLTALNWRCFPDWRLLYIIKTNTSIGQQWSDTDADFPEIWASTMVNVIRTCNGNKLKI